MPVSHRRLMAACSTAVWALLLLACSSGANNSRTATATAASGTRAATVSATAAAARPPSGTAASSALAGSPAAASAATPPPFSGPRTTVKMALPGRADQAPFELARQRGYFAQQGIDIQPVEFASGSEVIAAIAANQVQAGSGAPTAALFNAMAQGINLRVVADWAHVGSATDTTLSIIVRKDLLDSGAVKSMADLKGKSFAAGGSQGTVGDVLLQAAERRDGVNPGDIDVQYLALPDVLAALANKKIDAGTLTEPQVTQAAQQGIAGVLYPAGALIPDEHLALLLFSQQLAQNQDAATRFMVAYLRGVRDYYDAFQLKQNREAAIAQLIPNLSVKDPKVWQTFGPEFVDLNGKVNVADLQKQAQFHASQGSLKSVPDVGKYVDMSFADAAVKILGAR